MITLTMPIGPDLVASLTASAAAAGLPLDEHAENLLRGAVGLPGYGREQGRPPENVCENGWVAEKETEAICGAQLPRVEEVSSAVEKALRQELAQSQKQLCGIFRSVAEHLPRIIELRNFHRRHGPEPFNDADDAIAALRYIVLRGESLQPQSQPQ